MNIYICVYVYMYMNIYIYIYIYIYIICIIHLGVGDERPEGRGGTHGDWDPLGLEERSEARADRRQHEYDHLPARGTVCERCLEEGRECGGERVRE